jgi:hypothetical protein
MHFLLALVVALATAVPVGARAMPMPGDMTQTGMQRHCPNCPNESRAGANPHKMPACSALACSSTIATLTTPTLLPERGIVRISYPASLPDHWTAAQSAPDPFPPRSIVLV